MAEAGRPVSEGGAVCFSDQTFFDSSMSSTQPITISQLAGGSGNTSQEEPKEPIREICKEPSAASLTRESTYSCQEQSQPEHCVPPKDSSHPHSLAEMHTHSYHHKAIVKAINDNPQASMLEQSIKPATFPVHSNHSDSSSLVEQGLTPKAPASDTCGLSYPGGDNSIQEPESQSMLACKQPMQLQQCNIITTMCRGANSGEGGLQHQSRCVCVSSPKAAVKMEGSAAEGPLKCDKALCYGPYNHQVNFEDTFAAYCHPQPIPAPSQLLPRLPCVEPNCDVQRAVTNQSAMNHLTLPRLISSVSETGLDAKHLLRCCNLNCSWISLLPPGAVPQSQKHLGGEECCSGHTGHVRAITRDMGTMTAHKELREVGVQTGQTVTPHVYPQVCLAEESRSETSCSQTNTDSDGGKKPGGAPKSPVKEVKWDAEGMTWEVYGASVDPEELGLAIQKHLELQIKETASHAAKLSRQNTNTSRQRGNTQRKRSRMMGSIRTSACCASSTSAVD